MIENVLPLPRASGGWGILSLVIVILAVSSVAPFVQLEPGGPSITASDLVAAVIYLATWAPFFALVAAFSRWDNSWFGRPLARWAVHLVFLLVLPALHAASFVGLMDWLDPVAGGPGGLADARIRVLTLLGTLQYLVIGSVMLAVLAGTAARRERARAAELERGLVQLETRFAAPAPLAAPERQPEARLAAGPVRIRVRHDGRVTLIAPSEIDWIEAAGNYVTLHGRFGSLRHRATMGEMQGQLGPGFIRIRRSVLVRLAAIRYCEPVGKGSWVVVLGDQTKLTSSRSYRERLESLVGE